MAEIPSHLDNVKNSNSLIDLESHGDGVFALDDYTLSFVFDDIVLVDMIDEVNDGMGSAIQRNGLYLPTNSMTKAWRKGKVVLVGPSAKYSKLGDIVVFPNDKGASVSNLIVEGYGKVVKGMFLNEQRLFGICKPI
jgi:hypothetical protein